ncbi:hypothetical protein FACS1894211_00120 [Clostridia bacterium]|nr:hypothetical protein FACS1894211_00120 [Clostridia bacterium]
MGIKPMLRAGFEQVVVSPHIDTSGKITRALGGYRNAFGGVFAARFAVASDWMLAEKPDGTGGTYFLKRKINF